MFYCCFFFQISALTPRPRRRPQHYRRGRARSIYLLSIRPWARFRIFEAAAPTTVSAVEMPLWLDF